MLFVMILAALRAAFAVLALAILAMLLWGLITQPRRTVTTAIALLLFGLAEKHPLLAICAIFGALTLTGLIEKKSAEG